MKKVGFSICVRVLLPLCLLWGCATSKQVKMGDAFLDEGRWEEAYGIYAEALKDDPLNPELREKMTAARSSAATLHADRAVTLLNQDNPSGALEAVKRAITLNPGKSEYQDLVEKVLRKKEAQESLVRGQKLMQNNRINDAIFQFEKALDLGLPQAEEMLEQARTTLKKEGEESDHLSLKSRQPVTLKFQNAKLKEVFSALEKASGINILFDKDVKDDPVTLFVHDATFVEALNLIFTTNNLAMKKISDETILIFPKTKQKIDQYQDLLIRTFYLSHSKAKDVVNLLRTMLETRRIYSNDELNTVVIRETPEKIRLAEKIIEANDRKVAEVLFNVELLEIKRTQGEKYGLSINPSSLSGHVGSSGPGAISLQELDNLNNSSIFAVLPSVLVDFFKQESEAQVLANPRIRVIDNKQGKVKVGDRVPILLSTTNTTPTSTTGSSGGTSTTTSIEFKDVGIDLAIEPVVHVENDITLKIKLEVTSLGDLVDLGNGQRQFQFGNRNTETVLNVRDGETVIISGLLRDDDRDTTVKVPGLGDIPILGTLFSRVDKGRGKTDVVMSITPHIIRGKAIPSPELQSFWSGTEEAYGSRPVFSDLSVTQKGTEGVPGAPASPPRPIPTLPAPPIHTPEDASHMTFIPENASLSKDGEISLAVYIDDVEGLSAASVSIAYDPTILSFKQVAEGDFLSGDGLETEFTSSSAPGSNVLDVHLSRIQDEEGASGGGTLFAVIFKGERTGASRVDMRNLRLTDLSGKPIRADAAHTVVTVK
jgi:general secretion pathway protein D